MARTYLAGEAAVKLIPNAKQFHHTARRELAKDKISHGVQLTADATGFRREARERLKGTKLTVDVGFRPDVTGFRKEAQGKLDAGKQLRLTVDLRAKADQSSVARAHAVMQAQIDSMGPLKVEVNADTTGATAHITGWIAQQSLRTIHVRVEADTQQAGRNVDQLRKRGGADGGRSGIRRPVRKAAIGTGIVFAPIATQAVVGGLSAIVAAASQAAGALGVLPAVVTAAAAGFAALGIGAYGVAGAFQAISKANAASATSSAGKNSAAAARQVENASRGLAKAEKQVGRAQEDVARAQLALNKARKQAVRDLRDMNDELRKAPLNEREAALAIKQAQKGLQDAMAGGDSLDVEAASIDLEQAKIDYDVLMKQNQDLSADVQEANKKGVEGAEDVVSAKEAVVDANDAVADAQEGVIDAQNALTDAIEAQTDAMKGSAAAADAAAAAFAKLSPNAQDFVKKMQALGPAWTETRKFIQDKLFEGLGDSVTNLANNQLPVLKSGLGGIAALLNGGVRQALDVFSSDKAVVDFGHSMANFQGMFAGIANSFAPLSRAFINVVTVGGDFLPRFGKWIENASNKFAELTDRTRADGSMAQFFSDGIEMAKQLGRIISNVGHALGDFFKAGQDTGGGFLDTIELITGELREFTSSVEGQSAMKDFFVGVGEAVRTLAPILKVILQLFFETLGPALTDLVKAAGPGLVVMFQGLAEGLKAIAPVMGPLGAALGQVFAVFGELFQVLGPIISQVLTALIPAIEPLAELFAGLVAAVAPILPVVAELIGQLVTKLAPVFGTLIEAITPLIKVFADALMPIIGPLTDIFVMIANTFAEMFIPVIEQLTPLLPPLADLFMQMVQAVMPLIPPLIQIAMAILPPLMQVILALMPVFMRLLQIFVDLVNFIVPILVPVIKAMAAVIEWAFNMIAKVIIWAIENVVDPILSKLGDVLSSLGDVFNWLWEEVVKPVWNALGTAIEWVWENVISPAFEGLKTGLDAVGAFFSLTVDAVKEAWGALGRAAAVPINFVIRKVINGGIGKGWKAVDDFLGGILPDWSDVGEVSLGMKTGGMVPMEPGASPMRDSVLRNLMPGEIVMSVPAVNALGAGNLLAANKAAQMGGVDAQGMFPTNINEMAGRIRQSQFGMEEGGIVRPDDPAFLALKKGHEWAKSRDGRPYVLGGSADGAGGTDCSGFMSGIADVILGGTGVRQWATMAFNGGGNEQQESGPQSFVKGLAAGFSIGVLNGGPAGGHTAGTLGGVPGLPTVNVESGGSNGGVAYNGPATVGADNAQFPTKYHLPIVGGSFVSGGAGGGNTQADAQRRGITREVEKILDGILGPVKGLAEANKPPPAIRGIPSAIYDETIDPMKKWVLDKVSELTSADGWRDKLKGTLDAMNPASWFDQGGVANGIGFIPKNTIEPERVLSPYETALFEGLLKVLGVFGVRQAAEAIPVDIQKVDGMPTTADTTGRDVITGTAEGQPLQGAAIDKNTGEYLPANNVAPGAGVAASQPLFTNTPEWKVARNLADAVPFGLGPGKQMDKIAQKAPAVAQLGEGIAKAAPAYAAAIAGNPTELLANIGKDTAAWAQKTATDFSTFLPENAGGMMESALSMLGGPLIGTVNTGMSQNELVSTMEDVTNRQRRRSKTGRSRRA